MWFCLLYLAINGVKSLKFDVILWRNIFPIVELDFNGVHFGGYKHIGHILRLPINGNFLLDGKLTQYNSLSPIIEFVAQILVQSCDIWSQFGVELGYRLINTPKHLTLEATIVPLIFITIFRKQLGKTLTLELYVNLDHPKIVLIKLWFGLHRLSRYWISPSGHLVGLRHSRGLFIMVCAASEELAVLIRLRQIRKL